MHIKNKAEKFWDNRAKQFDKQSKYFELPPTGEAKQYLKNTNIVLDFGCATGEVTNEIAGSVRSVLGIDISSNMVEIAKSKAEKLDIKNVDFKKLTVFDESIKNESFNIVLCFNILHFFEDTVKILQRAWQLLESEGLIIIVADCLGEKTFSNSLQKLLFLPLIKLGVIPYMKFFKVSDLEYSLNNTGFQLVLVENRKSPASYFIVAKKK